jgi:hypothetical protein
MQAVELIKSAREFQTKEWPNVALKDAGGRPFEEWLVLMNVYLRKLEDVYASTPGEDKATGEPNFEGRERIEKYAATFANLAIWAVQSAAKGHD